MLTLLSNLIITKIGGGMIIFQIFARYAKYKFGFEKFWYCVCKHYLNLENYSFCRQYNSENNDHFKEKIMNFQNVSEALAYLPILRIR